MTTMIWFLALFALKGSGVSAWTSSSIVTHSSSSHVRPNRVRVEPCQAAPSSLSWFTSASDATVDDSLSVEQLKAQILQLGAALDRGQSYNPTSGSYYKETMEYAEALIAKLVNQAPKPPQSMEELLGEWELVLSTVPHGIFRSSPFFLAIQEAYMASQQQDGAEKALLFFKLHELQTCSWGVSKIGRVAQRILPDADDKSTFTLYSEFDTSIFSLTVIPILGWFKLLPTFGGCVVTASHCELNDEGRLDLQVEYTTSRPVPGLSGLGDWIWKVRVPVGAIWKLLPWNKGRAATCHVTVRYVDDDFRIVQDASGDWFVYTRPVVPRHLEI